MSSSDITYCGYNNCPNTDCERHTTHCKTPYASFAYFHDCNKYPPMEFSEELLSRGDKRTMTIDEAIKHCHGQAESQKKMAEYYNRTKQSEKDEYKKGMCNHCLECAEEHEQLAEWLKELKELREFAKFVRSEVLYDDFEEYSGPFAELACRKLVKLGLVKLDGNVYKEADNDYK